MSVTINKCGKIKLKMETVKFFGHLLYHSLLTSPGPFFQPSDYPDLTNEKWLVTGATGGIGLEISKILVGQNAELWLVGRSPEKLEFAASQLRGINANARIHTLVIDYSDLSTVKPAVNQLKNETNRLNGIIHNAGVMNSPPGSKTKQGIEYTVGVNNCATQLIQDLIDPLIESVPNGRIVWLSSLAHIGSPPHGFDVSVIQNGSPERLYSLSKSLNYIQAVQWSAKHPSSSVKSISVHPGIIKSDITRTTDWWKIKVASLFYYDTHYGALPPIYAALSPDANNNDYIVPFGRPGPVRPDIYRAARNERGEAAVAWIENNIKSFK